VDFLDTLRFRRTLNLSSTLPGFDARFDADSNGVVDAADAAVFQAHYLTRIEAPALLVARPNPAGSTGTATRPVIATPKAGVTEARPTPVLVVQPRAARDEISPASTLVNPARTPTPITKVQLDLLVQLHAITDQKNAARELLDGSNDDQTAGEIESKLPRARSALKRLAALRSALP
jgi:hypothetical protein